MNPAKLTETASLLFSLLLVYAATSTSAQAPDNLTQLEAICRMNLFVSEFLESHHANGRNQFVEIIPTCGTNVLTIDFNISYSIPDDEFPFLTDSGYRAYYECIYENGTVFTGGLEGTREISLQPLPLWEFSFEHLPGTECTVYGCYQRDRFNGVTFPIIGNSCTYPYPTTPPVTTSEATTTPPIETTMPEEPEASTGTEIALTTEASNSFYNELCAFNQFTLPGLRFEPDSPVSVSSVSCANNLLEVTWNTSAIAGQEDNYFVDVFYHCTTPNQTDNDEGRLAPGRFGGVAIETLEPLELMRNFSTPGTTCSISGCVLFDQDRISYPLTGVNTCTFSEATPTPTIMETTNPKAPENSIGSSVVSSMVELVPTSTPMPTNAPDFTQGPPDNIADNITIPMVVVILALIAVASIALCIPLMILLRLKRIQRQKFAIMRQGHFIKYPQELDWEHFHPVDPDIHVPVLKVASQVSLFDTLSPYLLPGQSDDDKSLVLQNSSQHKDSSSVSSILINEHVKSGDHMTEEVDHVSSQDDDSAPDEAIQLSNIKYPQSENGYVHVPDNDSKEESADIKSPVPSNGYIVEQSLKQSSSPTPAPMTKSEYIRQEDLKLKKPGVLQWNIPRAQPVKTQVSQPSSTDGGSSGYFTDLTTPTEYSVVTLDHKFKPSALTAHEGALEVPAETVLPLSPGGSLSITSDYSCDNLYSDGVMTECALSLSLNPSHFEPVKYEDIEPAVPSYMNTDQPNDTFYQSTFT